MGCGGLPERAPRAATEVAAGPGASAEAPARTELPIGAQLFEDDVTTPALEHLRASGVAWARVRALWKLIEAEPGAYDWTVTDRLFGDAADAGFRMVAVVYANPAWVTGRECLAVPPEHAERYRALWMALVERYDGDGMDDAPRGTMVRYWQVSNEPDFSLAEGDAIGEGDYGGCSGDDPAAYAEQLVVAYQAAKAADPSAQVGLAPLAWDRFTESSAPPGWTAPPGPFMHDFAQQALEALYRTHAGDPRLPFCDFVGLHNYPDNAHFWDQGARRELVARAAAFRDSQLTLPGVYDLRSLPLMVSETGAAAGPSDAWTERSEALQAAYVGQTMVRALAAGAMAAIWYTARDNIFGDCAPPHYDWLSFGLMRSDDYRDALSQRCPRQDWADLGAYGLDSGATPRPALTALATLTRALRGYSFERQLDEGEAGAGVEAYRFTGPGGRTLVAAWADDGGRLGRRGADPATARIHVGPALVQPWTGELEVGGHLGGAERVRAAGAAGVDIALDAAPIFIASRQGGP